jgi:hypothetical protein
VPDNKDGRSAMPEAIPLDAKSSRLGTVLKGTSFKVPDFQRPYSWGEDQIKDLWDDLLDATLPGTHFPHFFGTLLTVSADHPLEGGTLDVLDGQQRLTTFTLLLMALDRHLEELESPQASKRVREGIERTRSDMRLALLNNGNRRLRLRSEDDHLLANLLNGNAVGGTIGKAFQRLLDHVEALLEKSDDQFGDLQRIADAVLLKSVVIHAHCRAGFDSFVVFSTLNATGLPLTATQILRARSLGLVNQVSESVASETHAAWEAVEQLHADGDRFLQAFLVLRTGNRVQTKDIVRTFDREALRSKDLPYDPGHHFGSLARELKELVPIYKELSEGKWPTTASTPPDDWHNARVKLLVRWLGIRQLLPLLLATAANKSFDFSAVVRFLERVAFVGLVCLDNQTRWGDRTYQVASKVYSGQMDFHEMVVNIKEFFAVALIDPRERLAARLPEQLRYHGKRKTLIRYFLTTLNDWGFPDTRVPTLDIQASWVLSDIHIDHISAQRGSDLLDDGQRDQLGNLTPLKGKDNATLGNKPFEQKLQAYRQSPLRITRALGSLDSWDFDAVAKREAEMVAFAADLFCMDLVRAVDLPTTRAGDERLIDA